MPPSKRHLTRAAGLENRTISALRSLTGLAGAISFIALVGCAAHATPAIDSFGDMDSGGGNPTGNPVGSSPSSDVDSGGTGGNVNSGTPSSAGDDAGGSGPSSSDAGGPNSGQTGTSTSSITDVVPDSSRYAYSVTLKMQPFTVNANQEVYMCQDFANPFMGKQADIVSYELHMSTGSHHMFAFYTTGATNGSVAACAQGGLQFAPYTFTAGSPTAIETYPDGMGASIPTTTGFTINAHFINTGTSSLTGNVALTIYVAKTGEVTQHVGPIFLNQALLSVPPTGQPSTSTASYSLTQDVNLLLGASHMHKRATHFVSTASTGQMLFETTQWSEPMPIIYSPALHLASGTTITWSCTYVNDTSSTLTFGESASTNVMCISEFIYYPVQNTANPVLGTPLAP
jgi:hypothetical protein